MNADYKESASKPPRLWRIVRPTLVGLKRRIFFERPFALGSLGRDSRVRLPRSIRGRKYIHIGNTTCIMPHSFMLAVSHYAGSVYKPSILIGNNVYIGRYSYLVACDSIVIGDGCVLSEHVYITDLSHGYDPLHGLIMSQTLVSKGPVVIGPNSFLGYRTAVMPGVTLGEWCICGANSVVTRSFPSYSMVAGSPARLVKTYSHQSGCWVSAPAERSKGETN